MKIRHALDSLFAPKSIAVIGASDRPESVGGIVLQNLRAGGYEGELFAINAKRQSVQGMPCHPSMRALGRAVDLVIIAVPAESIVAVMDECGRLGVKNALVISAGFAESGSEGQRRQSALLAAAQRHRIRLVGPNCIGIVRPAAHMQAFFGRTHARPGRLALVSQSGALCTAIMDWAAEHEVGFSAVVSTGAAADVCTGDVLDFLATDPKTDAILLYVEGADHARRLLSGMRVAARTKPVVVLKAGRHHDGKRAAATHTGALIGDDAVFDSALRRAGAVRVMNLEELFSAAELLACGRRSRGNRLAIVTNAGGLGVMAADRAAEREVALAALSPQTIRALDAALPAYWSHANPVDLIGDAPPERYGAALSAVLADTAVDAALVLLSPQTMTRPADVARVVIAAAAHTSKPVLTCFMGGHDVHAARELLEHGGIPHLPSPEAGVDAFAQLAAFERNQRMLLRVPAPLADHRPPELDTARAIIDGARRDGRSALSSTEAKALLAAFHIPVIPGLRAATSDAACAAAEQLGLPVALKVDSPDILHKSDIGGVALGLDTTSKVRAAFYGLVARARTLCPGARVTGVTVEAMHRPAHGRELLAGIARDPAFGPVITFGAGGTLVELIADRALALPPLDGTIARDMIDRTRVRRLLGEFRGMPDADVAAVEHVLLRLSELACELPDVLELDINPLVGDEAGAVALDARVVLGAAQVRGEAERYRHMAIEPYPMQLTQTMDVTGLGAVTIRPIRPEDANSDAEFVRGLSSESRYFRFHHGLAELTPSMLARLTQIDYDREMAFVAVSERDGVERLLGVSRYNADPDGEGCEFALAVADEAQKHGIGTALMRVLVERARSKGLLRMRGEVLAENYKMLAFCHELGMVARGSREDPMLRTLTLDLSSPAPLAASAVAGDTPAQNNVVRPTACPGT